MSDDLATQKNDLATLKKRVEKMKEQSSAARERLLSQEHGSRKLLATTELEIQKLCQSPATPQRDHGLYLQRLRARLLTLELEALKIFHQIDLQQPNYAQTISSNQQTLNRLVTEMRFVALDLSITNYKATSRAVERALGAAPTRAATGSLQQPNLQRQGTGSLAPRTPSGPLPPRSGSGPLNPLQPSKPSGGTGALNGGPSLQRATAPLGAPAGSQRDVLLAAAAKNAQQRPLLEQLQRQYQDLVASLQPLRAQEPGALAVPLAQAEPVMSQIAGKLYYLNRTLQQLGAPFETLLAFEGEEDQDVLTMLSEAPPPQPAKGLTDRLRSFFGPH